MFNIGPEEIILLLVVALVFLGPNRLPEVARQIGKGLREFRSLSARARAELLQNVNLNEITDDPTDDETLPPLDVPALEAAAALEEAKDPSPNGKPKKKKGSKGTPVAAETASSEASEDAHAVGAVPTAEGSPTEDPPMEDPQIGSPVGGGAVSPEGATIDAVSTDPEPTDPAPIGSDTGSTEVSG